MRKLKNTLYILDETAYLTLDGENVVIRCDGAEKRRMPFTTIEEIYCFSYPGASPALMGACAERGVNLCFSSQRKTVGAHTGKNQRKYLFAKSAV